MMQLLECSNQETIHLDICIVNVCCNSQWGNVKDNIWNWENGPMGIVSVCLCHNCTVSSPGNAFVFLWQPIKHSLDDPSVSLHLQAYHQMRLWSTSTHTQLKKDSGERSEQVRRSQGILLPELIETTYGSPAITLYGPVTVNSKH